MFRASATALTLGVGATLMGLVCAPASAAAQEPAPDDLEMARELFRSGIEAAENERWSEARLDFERSYDLARRPSTLFNLANAQVEVGDVVAAAASYRLFLVEATGRALQYRPDAEAALAEIEPRIAEVTVSLSHDVDGDTLEVDGTPALLREAIPMNPGSHHLLVRRGDAVVGELDLVLVEGEQRGLTLPVRPAAVPEATRVAPPEPEDEDLMASPWLWLGVGAGAAVLTAVILGVVFAASGDEAPFEGNFGPGRVTFE